MASARENSLTAADPAIWPIPPDCDIKDLLVEWVDQRRQGVGIVIGVIDANGRRIVTHGGPGGSASVKLDGDTVFEIGSISKVFTALLLAELLQRGEIALDDPVAKFLPPEVAMPERGGRQITLIDLATHTSGLPPMPSNFWPADPKNPYADYDADRLYRFLCASILERDIGALFEYSNLGAGLLGHALARHEGIDYETLLRRRITDPLGLTSTAIALSPALQARLAAGHDQVLQPVPNWDLGVLAGAGALRSTANDLLAFLAAELSFVETPLHAAMRAQCAHRRPNQSMGGEVALGWLVSTGKSSEVIWHGGRTGGYRSFIGFDPGRRRGVVVLTNASTDSGGADLGFHLLTGIALPPRLEERHAIALDATLLDAYVGQYELASQAILTITRREDQLLAQITGWIAYEIFPEGRESFFYKATDARLIFEFGPDGRVTGLVLREQGREMPGTRVTLVATPKPDRRAIELDVDRLEACVGEYQLTQELTLTITRENDRLFAQRTGHAAYRILPATPVDFFWADADVRVTFRIGPDGRAAGLLVHKAGRSTTGIRVA